MISGISKSLFIVILFCGFTGKAQNFRPEIRANYLFGIDVKGNDVLNYTNHYAQLALHPQQITSRGIFLASQEAALNSGFNLQGGSSLGDHFYCHFSVSHISSIFKGPIQSGQTFYNRSISHLEYGLNIGYRFTPEKRTTMFVSVGAALINRNEKLNIENTYETNGNIFESELTAQYDQSAYGYWLEFGREYEVYNGIIAAWFFHFRSVNTKFNKSYVAAFSVNDENRINDLNTRESSFEFSGGTDNPDDLDRPRVMQTRIDNLASLLIGVRLGYNF
ncbi:MAG: hypothetical protein JJU02_07745 [Cryomorphaceae bacterium]|nr:hypothetical protein [Cryomorphaceae bacterium]